jgi:Cu2+-exporting ATPase
VPGDRVRVPVGQAFAADGTVLEGSTRADESLLTGESAPVAKACGAAVVAGSINLGAPVVMLVQRVGGDTRLEAIVALMRDAMSQRPAAARAADRWAGPFLWAVLVLAAGAAAVWSVVDPSRAVWVAVSVLIVTCPCALSLAAPSALLSAASALARRGVLLQRLDALEAFTQVQRIYLDKTGTVTDEHLQWAGLARLQTQGPCATLDDAQCLALAAGLAGWSSHPLSQALVAAATAGSAVGKAVWRDVQETPGQGLSGTDAQGRFWRLGRGGFVQADGLPVPQDEIGPGRAAVWLGCEGQALLRFDFDEALRPDARQAVADLQARGLEVVLLSGDRPERAQRMADQLGLQRVIGGATPESKLAEVAAAQAAGLRVAMVGDGINDAPVLARADVSFAMGQGALVARAQADAVVVSSRLADLVRAHSLARKSMRVIRQNLVWAAVYNAVCIPLALAGWLPPWAAGLGMASSSLGVILNSMRLAR